MQIKTVINFMTPEEKKIFFMTVLQCDKHFSRIPEYHLLIRSYFDINLLVRCKYGSA